MTSYCEFGPARDGLQVCIRCQRAVPANGRKIAARCRLNGPGAELKLLLAKFGITSTPTCGCNKMAKQMDAWGPEECLNHIEEIVDVMGAEAQKRKLPFIRTAGRLLVRKAIRNAKRKATGK